MLLRARIPCLTAALLIAAPTAAAQRRDPELVFVGSSVAGDSDPYWIVDVANEELVFHGRALEADNVSAASWDARAGELVTVATLGRVLCRVSGIGRGAPTWNVLTTRPHRPHGLAVDLERGRAYTLEGDSSGQRALLAIDDTPGSARRGDVLARCTDWVGSSAERWTLSPSGRFAVVPTMLMQNGAVSWIDTDPASPNYMRMVGNCAVPDVDSFAFCGAVELSPDEQFAVLAIARVSGSVLARLHLSTRRWVDCDLNSPGVQHRRLGYRDVNSMALAHDGSFAFVAGASGVGWLVRADFEPLAPSEVALREVAFGQGLLEGVRNLEISPDGRRLAYTRVRPERLVVLDIATGEPLSAVDLPDAKNLTSVAWCSGAKKF